MRATDSMLLHFGPQVRHGPKADPSSLDACGPGSWGQDQLADPQCVFPQHVAMHQATSNTCPAFPRCRACQELTNTAWALSQMQRSGVPFTPDVQASRHSELQLACCADGRALQKAFFCCIVSCTWMMSGPLTDVLTNSWPYPDAAAPHPRRGVGAAGRPQLAGARQAADRVQPGQRVSALNLRYCPAAVVARAGMALQWERCPCFPVGGSVLSHCAWRDTSQWVLASHPALLACSPHRYAHLGQQPLLMMQDLLREAMSMLSQFKPQVRVDGYAL